MTAEIAIMNRMGIALASDSAVSNEEEIFNSAKKIFQLTKQFPVAIMLYNSADCMGIPWETVIKMYLKETLSKVG